MPERDLERLRSLSCIKWTYYDEDVIPAWVADMDLPPAPVAVEAGRALFERGDLGYNFAAASRIAAAFSERQLRRFGWAPDPAHVRLLCDVMQGVDTAVWLHTDPGDGVVLLTPVYPPFYHTIEACGCELVDVPLDPDGWRIDADAVGSAITANTRVLLLCNPHNPSGRSFSREELSALADIAEKHDLLVVSDEIWADITYPEAQHVPFASLSDDAASRTITVSAASKAFNLAGLRCAVMHFGQGGLAEQVETKLAEIPAHVFGAVSSPGAEATLAAWTRGDEWLAETVGLLRSNRDRVAQRLATELPEVGFTLPEATYLAWLDLRALELGDDPAKELLERARVALSSGLDFGPRGAGFARLNFATNPALLEEILDRLIAAVSR